jgi:hypothetical protein
MIPSATIWVLVLIVNGTGALDMSLRFTTQAACNSASQAMQAIADGQVFYTASCVEVTNLEKK